MATEKRLIDANDLGRYSFHIMCEGEDGEAFERCVVDWDDIETAPTVDAVEVVHGRWNPKPYYKVDGNGGVFKYCDFYVCSKCAAERPMVPPDNYCPNCGAKMDGGKNG